MLSSCSREFDTKSHKYKSTVVTPSWSIREPDWFSGRCLFAIGINLLTFYNKWRSLMRGALGYNRNRKTEEKVIQNRKTANKIGQNRKPHTKVYTQIGPGPNRKNRIGKTENHIGYQNRKTASIFYENQMLKNEKSANGIEHQNRKADVF